jgi:3-hydroxyisobutyrate dehydrogenase
MKGEAMLREDFTPSFRLELAAKDARLAVEAGAEVGAEIPALEAIAAQMAAVAAAHPDEDVAALILGAAGDPAADGPGAD